MKKIGLLMGCFNPIHNAHIEIAKNILSNKLVDEIEVIPAKENINYKDGELISGKKRLEMLNIALNDYRNINVNSIEINQSRQYYTFETLRELKKEKKSELYLIIGSDNLRTFDKWKNYEEILKNYKIIVLARDEDKAEDIINENPNLKKYEETFIIKNNYESNDISSTFIRNNIKNKDLIESIIPKEVLEYIEKNKLYEEVELDEI